MLLYLVVIFISAIIMYYLFEKYNFKIAGFLYFVFSIGDYCMAYGFEYFLIFLIIALVKSVIVTLVYYKIYSISYSFWKFFGLSLIVEALLFVLYIFTGC